MFEKLLTWMNKLNAKGIGLTSIVKLTMLSVRPSTMENQRHLIKFVSKKSFHLPIMT